MIVRDLNFLVDVILLDLRGFELDDSPLSSCSSAAAAVFAAVVVSSCVSVAEPSLDAESVANE